MIIVTGGAGFIGSAFVWRLNEEGIDDILIVDRLGTDKKWQNLVKRRFRDICHKDHFLQVLPQWQAHKIEAIVHLGACSSTTERDVDFLMANNLHYSQELFKFSARHNIPFLYASSAATYGEGERGFSDASLAGLRPINPYGYSKHLFDEWVMRQEARPRHWAGLKFFNVYGPNEYHKGGQASVVFHAFGQVQRDQVIRLFKSYRDDCGHGEQRRDFVYVKDAVDVLYHLLINRHEAANGIYNIGSGVARTFADLGRSVFSALGNASPRLEWIEMPEGLRMQYQYFTQADMDKLRIEAGYAAEFHSLEDGVEDYVGNYLAQLDPYL